MKISSATLLILLGLYISCLFVSIVLIKGQYDKIDKSDPYWNFTKLKEGMFHHLKIDGGNVTKISFTPSPHGSIGILNYWDQRMNGRIETAILNDTLYLRIQQRSISPEERDWMSRRALISISCPDLLSVNGMNTNLDIYKLKERNLTIGLGGRSRLEVESYIPDFDSLSVLQRDSSQVVFEMSEEIRTSGIMHAKALYAKVQGHSILDVGHFQIGALHQSIDDSAAIILSGNSLKQIK
jgi:hypothetical protein